ncbi:hypothetical protein ACFE04_024530 [Oxalis oulophora]
MKTFNLNPLLTIIIIIIILLISQTTTCSKSSSSSSSITYIWPLPTNFTSGNLTLSVDPNLSLSLSHTINDNDNDPSHIILNAFARYKSIIFKHTTTSSTTTGFSLFSSYYYDITKLSIIVDSPDDQLQLGVDESYSLSVAKNDGQSIVGEITIWAKTVYGALRGLEVSNITFDSIIYGIPTFSQLCAFDYGTKSVQINKAPWYIQDKPRFAYRGLMIDTSRHYLPIAVIKQIIESMSYAKFNVLHWHIIDEESFPLEVPTYPNLWKGAYTKWERYTVEDAYEIVGFARQRGINVMAEVDVPGHAESWGKGYPDLWPSTTCREPLDVSKNFTFELLSGLLSDLRKIFPFELFHLGGDEYFIDACINIKWFKHVTDCWSSTPHVKQWLDDHNMTPKDAYKYFVLKAQEIAISKNWTPVNWEETFNAFSTELNPKTVVHNWLGSGVCPKAVAKGFRCIFSNQGVWYLDHLDVPWYELYRAEPLEGISHISQQKLVIGGEVCMWGETADTSNVLQTIWPRAAAAAERLWSESTSTRNLKSALFRLHNFKCLLHRRGVEAAPLTNKYARTPPTGPGSCYAQ